MAITNNHQNIVITGIGPVTAIGTGFTEFAKAVATGKSGIAEVTGFDVEDCRCKLAAEIVDFDVRQFLASEKGYLDRNSALAFAAARLALDDARLTVSPEMAPQVGLSLGTAFGNMETARAFYQRILEKGPKLAPPFIFPHTYNNTTASLLAIEHGIKGPHANFSSGAAAGAEALAYAILNLRMNRAQVMLAGGAETHSQPAFKALDDAHKLATTLEPVPDGFVLGEGACLLVLETEAHARQRGAQVRARVAGVGVAGEPRGAISAALQDAGLSAGDIAVVASAANGFPGNDSTEALALRETVGAKDVTMLHAKSLLGETVGASGPLNVAAAVANLETGRGKYALVNAIEPGSLSVALILFH